MREMYEKINTNKCVFVCGDFNIDLLNPNGLKSITEFISFSKDH